MSAAPAIPIPVPALKNILYATDFSQCSQAAMPYVHALAERYGSAVHFVHVCNPEPKASLRSTEIETHAAEIELRAEIAGNSLDEIPHTSTVKIGDLWQILAKEIEDKSVDLIVLGTHGRRGFKKLVLGSAAEQVFRHATRPVLTVGPQAIKLGSVDVSFARILFATDYSEGSLHALPYAISLAQVNRSHFMLLHVLSCSMGNLPLTKESVPPGMQLGAEYIGEALAYARRRLAEVISPETMRDLRPEVLVECGPIAETILNTARSKGADLIVIGAHRALSSHFPWAVATSVICQAQCPVLTVRGSGNH